MNLKLRELRRKINFRQQDLADKFHVSQQAIAKWENGESEPDIATLIKLSEFFGVTVDTLLGIERENNGLIRCPFCGGKADFHTDISLKERCPSVLVMCNSCKTKKPVVKDIGHNGQFLEIARKQWNRRTK